jgi:hypothetical protein
MAELDLLRDFALAAGGGFGGGLVVLVGQEIISQWRKPVLIPSVDTNQHRAVVITVRAGGTETTYFRLRVLNGGRSTARGCEVAIERLVRTVPTRVEYENDPISLGWSLIPTNTLDIHAGTARFSDIFRVQADGFQISSPMTPNYLADDLADSFRAGARFELTLRVSGHNVRPHRTNIVCGWANELRNPFAHQAA